jgi:hypothetical protein
VLRRKLRGRIMLVNGDRLFFVWLYRLFPSILRAILIIRPDTLVRWHRSGFRRYWRWKSRLRLGRCPCRKFIRDLIDAGGDCEVVPATHYARRGHAAIGR